MGKRKIFSKLRRTEHVSLKEGIDGVVGLIKTLEGYAQYETFDNNPSNSGTSFEILNFI